MRNLSRDALESARLIDRLERLTRSAEAQTGLNPAQWEALRFIARANRFSRNPAALADYLASTRGTVSQTLISLEEKGLIIRTQSLRDRRSLDLALTAEGISALEADPLIDLARDLVAGCAGELSHLLDMLQAVLRETIGRNGGRAFGACYTCRYFERAVDTSTAPHRCALLNEPLTEADSLAICAEQVDVSTTSDEISVSWT